MLSQTDDRRSSTKWGDFIVCPWCAGFWISGLVYVAWVIVLTNEEVTATNVFTGLGVWFALSAVVGALGTAYHAVAD